MQVTAVNQSQTTNTMVKINRHFSIGIAVSLPQLKNDVFLRSLLREPVPYTPIWLMRQAGRYLPEYRALRADKGSFLNLVYDSEAAAEITWVPAETIRAAARMYATCRVA